MHRYPEHSLMYHGRSEPCPDPDRCATLLVHRTERRAIIDALRHDSDASGLDSSAGIGAAFRRQSRRPAPLVPLPKDWNAPVAGAPDRIVGADTSAPFESPADRDRTRGAARMAAHYVDHTGAVRRARVYSVASDGECTVRRLVADPFRPVRRQCSAPDPSPVFGPVATTRWGVRTVDAWTLALITDRDAADSTVLRIEREEHERAMIRDIMAGQHTEGSAGLPWDSVHRRAPSVAQAHERAQTNYARSLTAPGPDGIPLGTVLRIDGADGIGRAIDPTVRVRADRIRAARKRWAKDDRPVRCDGDTDGGHRPAPDACGDCKPCKARDRDRRRNARKREERTRERAEHAERVTAWERAHGQRVAARHGM